MLISSRSSAGLPPSALRHICLCVTWALPALAAAQQTPAELPEVRIQAAQPGATTEGSNSYTTGRTSTATPLGLSLRETPQSVTVVTQQRMADQGMKNITDVLNSTTGVSVNQYETNRAQLNARGFDINSLMIDGVPTTWQAAWASGELFTSLAMYDRVEVARGATGLTSGTGYPSAAVNLVRKRATAKEFTGSVDLSVGRWNQRGALVDLSTPVNAAKTVRIRLVGEYSDKDSWTQSLHNKNNTLFGTLEADLTPDTLLHAGASRQTFDTRGPMWGGFPLIYQDGTATHWGRSQTSAASWTRWDTTYNTYFVGLEHRLGNGWKLSADYNRGERKADSHLLYLYGLPDGTSNVDMGTWPGSYITRTRQDDLGIQARGPFDLLGRRHDLSVGYTYSKQDFKADSRTALTGLYSSIDYDAWNSSWAEPSWSSATFYQHDTVKKHGLYGAANFSLADPLKLILGTRVTHYQSTRQQVNYDAYNYKTSHKVTPYAGLVFDLNDQYSLYASYTSIFQPQFVRDASLRPLDPVEGKSFETGVKGEWLNGALNGAASIFHIKQNNLGQATSTYIGAAEQAYKPVDATSKGFELEVSGELTPGWNISAGYTHYKLTSADGSDVNTTYPRNVLRLFSTYRLRGSLQGLTLGGGMDWQGGIYSNYQNAYTSTTVHIAQKAYAIARLMARYEFSPRWSAQLNIDNLFDKKYVNMWAGTALATYGAPRNATLSVKYKF